MASYELPWNGLPIKGPFLAFDTETDASEDKSRHQQIVLMTISTGARSAVVRPDQISRLILMMPPSTSWIGHNVAFDYWVVHQYLEDSHQDRAVAAWENILSEGRFLDTMLEDFLIRLADSSEVGVLRMMGLEDLAKRRLGWSLSNKQDDHRMRFKELIGREKDWPNPDKVDQKFLDYAVADAVDTAAIYQTQVTRLSVLSRSYASVVQDYGWLTEGLQVKAAVVLQQVGVNGMVLDRTKLDSARTRLKGEIDTEVGWLSQEFPLLFDRYKVDTRHGKHRGEFKANNNGIPHLKTGHLREYLLAEAQGEGLFEDLLLKTDKTQELTTALDYWRETLVDSPLVDHWSHLADLSKLYQFVVKLDLDLEGRPILAVHPEYRPLVRTGRTSCTSPNIQQMPKEPWFRSMFVARPGHQLVVADYSAIEITTLAAVLYQRYGPTTLYRVLQEGRDPHSYTASLVTGWSYDTIRQGVKDEKASGRKGPYTQARQSAKAINFGVPGGLGARRLADYARRSYGVDMTPETAKRLRDRLINEVYPELGRYLADDLPSRLAQALHTNRETVVSAFNPRHDGFWRNVGLVLGQSTSKKVRPASGSVKQVVWSTLAAINRNPELTDALYEWKGGESFRRRLTGETVVTLTGRVRSGADYGEARNTPFQGLAADGAKVALWRLHQKGFRIVAFVHDEIVTEVLTEEAHEKAQEQVRIMKESMESVLYCDLPVEVEYAVSASWTK